MLRYKIRKILAVYFGIFVLYFTLMGFAMMTEEKGFFDLNRIQVLVRFLLPAFITLQLYYQWSWLNK